MNAFVQTLRYLLLAVALTLLGACSTSMHHGMEHGMGQAGGMGVMVSTAWSRQTPPGTTIGAIYLRLDNHGAVADRLLGASSPVAERVEIHESSMEAGMMKMRQIEQVTLSAGDTVMFAPGGLHLMLFGLNQPLQEGETFDLALDFEQAGTLSVPVRVQAMGADSAPMDHSGHKM